MHSMSFSCWQTTAWASCNTVMSSLAAVDKLLINSTDKVHLQPLTICTEQACRALVIWPAMYDLSFSRMLVNAVLLSLALLSNRTDTMVSDRQQIQSLYADYLPNQHWQSTIPSSSHQTSQLQFTTPETNLHYIKYTTEEIKLTVAKKITSKIHNAADN